MREERAIRLTKRGRWLVALAVVSILIGVPAAAGYGYLRSVGYLGESRPGAEVEVVIPEGAGAAEIGRILEDAGVIRSATGFRVAAYFDDSARDIQAGRYMLPTGLTAPDALAALSVGARIEFVNVTFPEGSWLTDFARIVGRDTHLDGDRFLRLAQRAGVSGLAPRGVDTSEGLLFPSTYQVVESDTETSLLERLATEMEDRVRAVETSAIEALGYSTYEMLIVASMVEAEAGVDADRGPIARVIYNRLELGMRLQIDATVIYALGEHRTELTVSDLEIDSPYNTRRFEGLPPTPIGAPGAESLAAAAAPPEGDWIYYVVADCEGNHAFSSDYDEFLRDKAAYQALDCG